MARTVAVTVAGFGGDRVGRRGRLRRARRTGASEWSVHGVGATGATDDRRTTVTRGRCVGRSVAGRRALVGSVVASPPGTVPTRHRRRRGAIGRGRRRPLVDPRCLRLTDARFCAVVLELVRTLP